MGTAFIVDKLKDSHDTPLSLSLMPPPIMYLFILSFSSAVRDIAFYSRNSKNCLAVFLSDGNLSFVEFPALNTWDDLEGRDFNVEISDCKTALGSIVHLLWLDLDVHSLLCVYGYGSCLNKCLSSGSYETELHGSYLQEIGVPIMMRTMFLIKHYVAEFVCAMKNKYVTENLYKKFSFSKKEDKVFKAKDRCSNKVSSVIQTIRKALEEHIPESPSRELCILTTIARSDPPAIEESLLRIKSLSA